MTLQRKFFLMLGRTSLGATDMTKIMSTKKLKRKNFGLIGLLDEKAWQFFMLGCLLVPDCLGHAVYPHYPGMFGGKNVNWSFVLV